MNRMLSGLFYGLGIVVFASVINGTRVKAEPEKDTARKRPPTCVAVIDMSKVFKASRDFETRREELKSKIGEAEVAAKEMQSAIQLLKTSSDKLEKGSEEKAEVDRQLKQKTAEFETYRRGEAARFMKLESEIYREVYESVTAEIATYAKEHGIDLIIRCNADSLNDADTPQKIMEGIKKNVIYHHDVDITEDIIAAMN